MQVCIGSPVEVEPSDKESHRQWMGLLDGVPVPLCLTHDPVSNPNKLSYLTTLDSLEYFLTC